MSRNQQVLEKSRLGRLLVNRGYITEEQLNLALLESHATGRRIGEHLVAAGLISEKQLNATLRRQRRTRNVAAFVTMMLAPLQPMMAFGATTTTQTESSATFTSAITVLSGPQSLSVTAGQSATFSVKATGSNLKYYWFKDGVIISGATSPTYTIAATTTASAGSYRVKIYTGTTLAYQSTVSLTVAEALSITSNPASVAVTEGQAASFKVTATGSSLKYQWYKDSVAISGATAATYSIAKTATTHAGGYQVKVTSGTTVKWSSKATLTVAKPVVATVTITSQPKPLTVTAGQPASFAVTASGTSLQYQWYKNGTALSGATAATYALTSTTTSHAGTYQVRISSGTTVAWSANAALTVNAPVVEAPKLDIVVSLPPVSASVFAGKSHTFNVAATGSGTLKYQWRKNGVPIANAVLPYLSIASLKLSDAGVYDVLITNTTGTLASKTASLDVTVDRSARLNWTPPSTRVNGATLNSEEIAAYRIYHSTEDGKVETVYDIGAGQNAYELADLISGTHFFAITAIDTKGFESDLSNMASKEVVTGL